MNICPCCKRKLPVSKGSGGKLEQDRAKAQRAIDTLMAWTPEKDRIKITPCPVFVDQDAAILEANRLEAERLRQAMDNPALLWSIYRRNDKGVPYYA